MPVLLPARLRDADAIAAIAALAPGPAGARRLRHASCRRRSWTWRPTARSTCTRRCCRDTGARHPSRRPSRRATRRPGVSLIRMDAGIDTGPIVAQRRVPLGDDEDTPGLEARLAADAARLLIESLPGWLDGHAARDPAGRPMARRSPDPSGARMDDSTRHVRRSSSTDRSGRCVRGRAHTSIDPTDASSSGPPDRRTHRVRPARHRATWCCTAETLALVTSRWRCWS